VLGPAVPRLREPKLLWNPARLQQAPPLRELGILRPAPQPRPALMQPALVQLQQVLRLLRRALVLLRRVLVLLRMPA
jgi:hypothetical protein